MRESYLEHLICSLCALEHGTEELQTVCRSCGAALLARYDLEGARNTLRPADFAGREATMWRYRELLPVRDRDSRISLGEGWTPLLRLARLEKSVGLKSLYLKEEGPNPTGSFKARGFSAAVSRAKELGVGEVCVPTAGNAGGALAAYASAAGLRAHVFMPADTPRANVLEIRCFGADARLVQGLISDAAKAMTAERSGKGWFDMSTMKEPYRLEGKKTLGYELAEQLGWSLPDVILYPTGGGTGLIGMWKAFDELERLGWTRGVRPKMVAVQMAGCAPIVRAFRARQARSEFWEGASTAASGLRVPKAFADHLILDAVYASGGTAVSVPDGEALAAMKRAAESEGLMISPEGAATLAALPALRESGFLNGQETVVAFNTGSGYKYGELMQQIAGARTEDGPSGGPKAG